jgi:PAS domain S-box-containing protein
LSADPSIREKELLPDSTFWTAFGAAPVPMFVVDDERRYVNVNAAGLEMLNISAEEILGRRIDDFTAGDLRDEIGRTWLKFRQQGSMTGRWPLRLPSGQVVEVRYIAASDVLPGRHLAVVVMADLEHVGPLMATGGRGLTPREREVLALLAAGKNTAGVAEHLVVSPDTARTHIRHILEKLEAHTRAQAIAIAIRHGELDV